MHLEHFFDKIYCINLKDRTDRWAECKSEFSKQGFTKVTKFNAISGIPTEFTAYGSMNINLEESNSAKRLSGRVGCLLSHLAVIKDAKKRKLKNILILEDDVQFVPNINTKFSELTGQIPADWTLLYFGGNEKGIQTKISENIYRTSSMLMAHAIGINQIIYDEIICLLSECKYPVDVYYALIQKEFPCYSLHPYLAWQRAGWSDIEQRFRIYDLECTSPALENIFKCNSTQ